jgi:hypothetical protein
MVEATQQLVRATQRLGKVTWWLVAGTALMGFAAAVDVVLRVTRSVH